MENSSSKKNVSKIYCEKCNEVFESKKKYEIHLANHTAGVSCESCPIDTVVDKIIGLFKKAK